MKNLFNQERSEGNGLVSAQLTSERCLHASSNRGTNLRATPLEMYKQANVEESKLQEMEPVRQSNNGLTVFRQKRREK